MINLTEEQRAAMRFDLWCKPEFDKVLEKEVARLERGALPYSDKQIGDMLGCTKSEVYNFRRRQHIPDGMGRMANCCSNIMRRYKCTHIELLRLQEAYKIKCDLVAVNEKLKWSEKAGWFVGGVLTFAFMLVLCALIFGERAAS